MIISRSIHVAINAIILLFSVTDEYAIVYVRCIFIHSSVDGHLGCLHALDIVNSAVNIEVYTYF